jgi:hypothetical protein
MSYKELVDLIDTSKVDSFSFVYLYTLSTMNCSKIEKARLHNRYSKEIIKLLDDEGRLELRFDETNEFSRESSCLDFAWRCLKADKLLGFANTFTIALAVLKSDRIKQTLAYKECKAKYDELLEKHGLVTNEIPAV